MQLYKPGIAFPNNGNPWPIMEEASEDGEYYYKEDVHDEIDRLNKKCAALAALVYPVHPDPTGKMREPDNRQLRHDVERLTAAASAEATEVERTSTLLGMVAVHLEHPELGGLSEDQRLAISEWYETFRENRIGVPQEKP